MIYGMDDPEEQLDAEWHQVMQERERAAVEALLTARAHGTPDDALMTLAYEAGVANTFYKEIRDAR